MPRVPKRTVALEGLVYFELRAEILDFLETHPGDIPRKVCREIYLRHGYTDPIAEENLWRLVCLALGPNGSHWPLTRDRKFPWHIDATPWTRAVKRKDPTLPDGPCYGLEIRPYMPPELTDYAATRGTGEAVKAEHLPELAANLGKGIQRVFNRVITKKNEFDVQMGDERVRDLLLLCAQLQATATDAITERNAANARADTMARLANRLAGPGGNEGAD